MYMKPDWVVDPHMRDEFDLNRDVIDEKHIHLLPYMRQLETGEQVDLHELSIQDMCYIRSYYLTRVSNKTGCCMLFHQDLKYVNGSPQWWGHLDVPTVPAPHIKKQLEEQKAEERKQERRHKWIVGSLVTGLLLKMWFGRK